MLDLIRQKLAPTRKNPIPFLTYGSKLLNSYTQMAKLLQCAPAMPVTPHLSPTVHVNTSTPVSAPEIPLRVTQLVPIPVITPFPQIRPISPPQIPSPPPRVGTPTPIDQPQNNPSPPVPTQPPRVEINNQHKIRKIKEYQKTHLNRRASILQHRHQTRQAAHQRPNYRQLAQAAVIQERYQHHIDHLCNLVASPQHFTEGSGKQGKINKLVAGPNGPTWTCLLANEFGRLCKGIEINRPKAYRIKGTDKTFFTTKGKILKDRKITYANFICNIRPQKSETHRVRLTAGGNKLNYPATQVPQQSPSST